MTNISIFQKPLQNPALEPVKSERILAAFERAVAIETAQNNLSPQIFSNVLSHLRYQASQSTRLPRHMVEGQLQQDWAPVSTTRLDPFAGAKMRIIEAVTEEVNEQVSPSIVLMMQIKPSAAS